MSGTGLIIVDMQNAFCSPNGSFRKRGFEIIKLEPVIKNIRYLIAYANKAGWLLVFTKLVYKVDYSNAGLLVKCLHPEIKKYKAYIENTWDSEIIDELKDFCTDDAVIVNKTRYDPFIGTDLKEILRKRKIIKIIVAGLLTNVCIESTIRAAFDHDFEVILIKEATSTYSKYLCSSSLATINKHFGKVISINDILNRGKN